MLDYDIREMSHFVVLVFRILLALLMHTHILLKSLFQRTRNQFSCELQ